VESAQATFTDETYVFDNTGGLAGFGDRGASSCCDIIQSYDSAIGSTAFASYDLKSSIGPLGPEASDPSTGDWVGLNTSLGSFTVTSYDSVVFQATVGTVPEPTTLPVVGIGLVGMMIFMARRRRFSSQN
jgi:PEP-CTERM motif